MKPIKLKNRKGGRAYCGPTVVACITGADVKDIERRILDRWNKGRFQRAPRKRVVGTSPHCLQHVLETLGYSMCDSVANTVAVENAGSRYVRRVGQPTLGAWLKAREAAQECNIVHVANHWVVVQGNEFADTGTGGVVVPWSKAPHLRKRVVRVYKVARK